MVSRSLLLEIEKIPVKTSDTEIQFERTETWSVTKASLLSQKQSVESQMLDYQKQLDEINNLLKMFEI